MVRCQGIQVDILVDQEPQQIYDDPEPRDSNKPKKKVFYVEAITDAKFAVKVTLRPGFDLLNADGCRINFELDGKGYYHYVPKKSNRDAHQVHSHGLTDIFSTRRFYDPVAQQEKTGELYFGSLRVFEFTDMVETPATFKQLGKIRVTVARVYSRPMAIPKARAIGRNDTVTQVSEKLLKGQAIENSIQITNAVPIQPRKAQTHEYKRLPGVGGHQFEIIILYRSKKALQSLGCIPRTPSPAPELVSVEEFNAMKARLAILERNLAVKGESLESNLDLTTTGISGTIRIKRERVGNTEIVNRKRLREPEIEVVDLTDD